MARIYKSSIFLGGALLASVLLGALCYLFFYDSGAKQKVQIFLPEGYCDGFTVFYEKHSEDTYKSAIRVGDNPDTPVTVFKWDGDKGVLLQKVRDDIAVGVWFYYFNRESQISRPAEFRKVRIYSNASNYEIRPTGDSCGDHIIWDDDARDPGRYLRELRDNLRKKI